jgi:tripartite-type tricarboxylate transporter receptor subunit TctC
MNRLIAGLTAWGMTAFAISAASAQPVSFKGRTVSMVVGYAAGGGTDVAGRLIASMLGRYLPGEPQVVVQNVPGAEGLMALNFFVQQAKQDGLTITMGSGSQAEPAHYRNPQSRYDPSMFNFVGGAGRGGSALVIAKAAETRLLARDFPSVVMGTTSGAFRANMQMAAWGREVLGWNLRWVGGYRGTSDLFVALDRGEIDMTATSNIAPIAKMLTTGRFKILVQSGSMKDGRLMARGEFGDAPLMPTMVADKIKDPVAAKGFEYWSTLHSGPDKWLALPPGTPEPIVAAYREAYAHVVTDPDFIERSKRLADDFTPVSFSDTDAWIKAMGRTSKEALDYISTMIRGQGITAER